MKIGSGEMTDIPSLIKISELGKPMILSTGMSDLLEIDTIHDSIVFHWIVHSCCSCVSGFVSKLTAEYLKFSWILNFPFTHSQHFYNDIIS